MSTTEVSSENATGKAVAAIVDADGNGVLDAIAAHAQAIQADLIVMGTHGRGARAGARPPRRRLRAGTARDRASPP